MKKKSQDQGTMDELGAIQEQLLQLAQQGIQVPDAIKLSKDPEQIRGWLEQINNKAQETSNAMEDVASLTQKEYDKKLLQLQQLQQIQTGITAKMKPFNLKKAQVMAPPMEGLENPQEDMDFEQDMDMPQDPDMMSQDMDPQAEPEDTSLENLQLSSVDEFIDNFLDTTDYVTAKYEILENVPTEIGNSLDEILRTYYETDWETADDPRTKKIQMVLPIWEHLNPSAKADTAQEGVIENAEYKTMGNENQVLSFINDVTDSIKKLAESDANKNKSFNLKKQAQAKTTENVIMYGPSEKRFDAFLRQPISDWHIMERNKGFGFVVDDVWNIDWEAIWRGNIMDKYSRPYRDTKTGEWIGGYIQKRFEVDKWIPEGNNYQLLPGQTRKPYLPETRSTEARLEAMREKEGDKRGYEPVTEGKPFNWKVAQEKKKIKHAQLDDRRRKAQEYRAEYNDDIRNLAKEVLQTNGDPHQVAFEYLDSGKFSPEDIFFTIAGYSETDFYQEKGSQYSLDPIYTKSFDDKDLTQYAIKQIEGDISSQVKLLEMEQTENTEEPAITANYKKKIITADLPEKDKAPPGTKWLEGDPVTVMFVCQICNARVKPGSVECPNCHSREIRNMGIQYNKKDNKGVSQQPARKDVFVQAQNMNLPLNIEEPEKEEKKEHKKNKPKKKERIHRSDEIKMMSDPNDSSDNDIDEVQQSMSDLCYDG